jgi:hypothetical protein
MPKLFISILCLFTISLGLLQLRQQRLNYRFEINRLHDRIESSQAKLWNQQLKIATQTTPEALVKQQVTIPAAGPDGTAVVPTSLPAPGDRRWLDSRVIP